MLTANGRAHGNEFRCTRISRSSPSGTRPAHRPPCMVCLLATLLLSAAPVTKETSPPPARTVTLRTRIDFGGMIISYWYVPETRAQIEAAIDNAAGSLLGDEYLDTQALLRAAPVIGPWLAAARDVPMTVEERTLLCVTGVLQLAGLTLGVMRLFEPMEFGRPRGPVLSVSPIASGRLGISFRITGY